VNNESPDSLESTKTYAYMYDYLRRYESTDCTFWMTRFNPIGNKLHSAQTPSNSLRLTTSQTSWPLLQRQCQCQKSPPRRWPFFASLAKHEACQSSTTPKMHTLTFQSTLNMGLSWNAATQFVKVVGAAFDTVLSVKYQWRFETLRNDTRMEFCTLRHFTSIQMTS
jgi:hypothetical protein